MVNLRRLLISFLALALLALPFVASEATVTSSAFVWPSNAPIEFLKPNVATTAYLKFSFIDDQVTSIAVNYSAANLANPAPVKIIELGTTDDAYACAVNAGNTTCYYFGNAAKDDFVILDTDQSAVAVTYTFTYADGSTSTQTMMHAFTLDGTRPTVTSIATQACDDTSCYVHPGQNNITITMEDETASFNRARIAFTLAGKTYYVDACSGLTCTAAVLVDCADGQNLKAAITSYKGGPSSDDAGNALQGDLAAVFVCDGVPPALDDLNFSVSSGLATTAPGRNHPFLPRGNAVTLTISGTEDSSQVLAVLNLSAFDQDDARKVCTTTDGAFTCALTFSPTLASPQANVVLPLTLTDFAGNTFKQDLVVDVVEQDDNSSDDWSSRDPSLQYANKHYLEFASKDVFLTLSLSKNAHVASAILLDAFDASCTPKKSGNRLLAPDANLLTMEVLSHAGTSVFLKGTLQSPGSQQEVFADFDQVQYTCSVHLQTLRGEYLSMAEEQNFTVTFKLYSSSTIGEQVSADIERELNSSVKLAGQIAQARKVLTGMQLVCSAPGVLKSVGGVMSGTSAAMDIYPPLKTASETLDKAGTKLQEKTESMAQNVLGVPCSMISCDSSLVSKTFDKTGISDSGTGQVLSKAGFNISQSMFNPYQSWLASIMTMCVPAMIYHVDNYLAIDCDYVACLSNDVGNLQASLDTCQQRRDYGTCVFMKGGLINAIPFYSAFKDLSASVLDVFRDPISFFTTAGLVGPCVVASSLSENAPGFNTAQKLCKASAGLAAGVSTVKKVQLMVQQTSSLFSSGSAGTSVCQSVQQHIDPQTLYWEYGGQYDQDNIDYGKLYKQGTDYSFNPFTGYTTTVKSADGKTDSKVSIMPQMPASNGGTVMPVVYVDGKKSALVSAVAGGGYLVKLQDGSSIDLDKTHVELAQKLADENMFSIDNADKSKYLQWYKEYSANVGQWKQDLSTYDEQIKASTSTLAVLKDYEANYAYVTKGHVSDNNRLTQRITNKLPANMQAQLFNDGTSIDISQPLSATQQRALAAISEGGKPSQQKVAAAIIEANQQYQEARSAKETVETVSLAVVGPTSMKDGEVTQTALNQMEETTKKTLADAKKNKKDTEKKIGGDDNVAQAAARYVDENWRGSAWIGSTFAAANLASNILHTVKPDQSTIGWGKNNVQIPFVENLYDALTAPAGSNACQKKVAKSTDAYVPFSYDASTSSSANGAFVAALRQNNGDNQYSYLISAFVANRAENVNENLTFSIYLRSSSRSEKVVFAQDDNGHDLTSWSVPKNSVKAWTGQVFLRVPFDTAEFTKSQYDEVCIRFDNNNLDRWFAMGRSNQREFCREVELG